MRKLFLLILILITHSTILLGCSERYFPKGAFSIDDDLGNKYYTELLVEMDEPSIWLRLNTDKKIESYRLLIDPPFGNIICIRIDIDYSGKTVVYEKVASHDNKDENGIEIKGELIASKTKELEKKEIYNLLNQIEKIKLFEMNSEDFPIHATEFTSGSETYFEVVTDVPLFIFEQLKGDKYKFIEMPLPNDGPIDNAKLDEITQLFFELAED